MNDVVVVTGAAGPVKSTVTVQQLGEHGVPERPGGPGHHHHVVHVTP
jgi:NADPH-dependent curcumin reductase CurA